jgi:sirohydrochlorin cobaltochelatase
MESKKANSMKEKVGILLISHGSRLPESSKTINKLADMYREYTAFKVGVGYMELHEPNIPTALDDLVKNTEIDTVIVVPVFLAHGMHTTRDIPRILGIANDNENSHNHHDNHKHNHGHNHSQDFEKVNFDGKIIYTEPLGADPLLVEIIKNRLDTALNS